MLNIYLRHITARYTTTRSHIDMPHACLHDSKAVATETDPDEWIVTLHLHMHNHGHLVDFANAVTPYASRMDVHAHAL